MNSFIKKNYFLQKNIKHVFIIHLDFILNANSIFNKNILIFIIF